MLVAVLLAGADDVAADLILSVLELKQRGALVFALHEPFAGKLGYELGKAYIRPRAGKAAYGEKHLVAPYDAGIVEPENDDGQREIEQSVVFRRLRVVGDRFDVRHQRLALAAAAYRRIYDEPQNGNSLGRREIIVLHYQRRCREHDEEKHERSCIRFKNSL